VVPLGEERCEVSLTMDVGNTRSGWFWGLGVAVGTPLSLIALAIVLAESAIADPWVVLAPAILGVMIAFARAGYGRSREKMLLILDGLLDRLEQDEPLEPPRPAWRDLLK
jgi:hypothetical protein